MTLHRPSRWYQEAPWKVLPPSSVTAYAAWRRSVFTWTKTQPICFADDEIVPDINTSLNVSLLVINPACIAGVRISLPNFRAR